MRATVVSIRGLTLAPIASNGQLAGISVNITNAEIQP